MNGVSDASSPVLKRSTSPRPPAVGEEVKRFHDTSHHPPEHYKNWNMECSSRTVNGESEDRSVTPTCKENAAAVADSKSTDCIEKPSYPNVPAPCKWAESLHTLLKDPQGIALFQEFLSQEGLDRRCLSFWFACNGLKKHDPNDRDGLYKSIKVVFQKNVKRISAISDATKEEIKQKLESNTGVDDSIFDIAQQEVEAFMKKTTYPNFFQSDLYLQHLERWRREHSPEKEQILTPEPVEQLPTVHEDAELQIAAKIPLTKTNLLQRNKASYFKSEASSGLLRSPYSYSSYHTKYGSYLPVSAQDSELQSLSSDAQTDDTMSLTDGSNVEYPLHTRTKHKRSQKMSKHVNTGIVNKDEQNNQMLLIPRTERVPPEATKQLDTKKFHALLVQKLNKYLEDQKGMERVAEKLKAVETCDSSKPDEISFSSSRHCRRSNANPVFDPGFLTGPSEENVQDILDQHISRVFDDSGQHTPASDILSPSAVRLPGEVIEKSHAPVRCSGGSEPFEYSSGFKQSQVSQPSALNSVRSKYRKDHDSYPTDSAMFDYKSDDSMLPNHRSQYSSAISSSEPMDYNRRAKEQHSRRSTKKFPFPAESSNNFFDSGICLANENVPNSNSNRKTGYNSYWGGSQDIGYAQWSGIPASQVSQDFSGQGFPDTEARRKLEDENRAKNRMKKQNKKSPLLSLETATASHPQSNDVTVIGYSYGRNAVPYLSKMPGKNITLRQFKSMLSKKGNFRYFFKTANNEFGTKAVFEEVTDDCKVLPMWEGKVFCVIDSMDDSTSM